MTSSGWPTLSTSPRSRRGGRGTKLHADRDLLDAVLTALEWQTRMEAWQRDGGRYVPNPATWLNGRRWEDEPQAEAAPDKPPRRRKEETEVW